MPFVTLWNLDVDVEVCAVTNLFMQITEDRLKLPMASYKDVVTSAVDSNQVNLKLLHHVITS